METLSVRSREGLTSHLASKISNGEYKPGDLLPSERALAEEYKLSRTMVRESLRVLAERRLIDILPGRGSEVRAATLADSVERLKEVFDHAHVTPRNLIEARVMIESTSASLAAQRRGPLELESIRVTGANCIRAESLLERVRWDLNFHLAIVHAAMNPLVEMMFHAIRPYVVELLFRSLSDQEVLEQGLAFHQRIVDAISHRDADVASQEMSEHLTLGITLFGQDLDRNLNAVAQDALAQLSGVDVTFEDVMSLTRD